MNLHEAAEAEPERRTRSKLEPHREAILSLRRKHWTYGEIAKWLNEHGVKITLTSVYRFCERAVARRPRNATPFESVESQPLSVPPATIKTKTEPTKYRFNLDI